jgi:Fe-S-cluster containining protein
MPAILCEHCTAVCCRYIALPLDKPRGPRAFDNLRWFLMHEGVFIFVEDGQWYIGFETTCRHLQADDRCGIYSTRPTVCREYSADDCDYHSGDYGWQHHFTAPEHIAEFERTQATKPRRGGPRRSHARKVVRLARHKAARAEVVPPSHYHSMPLPVLPARS